MKTPVYILIVLALSLSCQNPENAGSLETTLTIHEFAKAKDIPSWYTNELKAKGLEFSPKDELEFFISIPDSIDVAILEKIQLDSFLLTLISNSENKFTNIYTLIYSEPYITNSDIRTTKAKGNNIEIYFNMTGARKWSDFTKENTGRRIAFLLNQKLQMITVIQGEIKDGIAIVGGFNNDESAKQISESLNH